MAKKNPTNNNSRPKEEFFTNSKGISVKLISMPALVIPMIADSVKYPTKPTYTVETAAGDVETFDHDETTLTTPEDHAAWEEYQRLYGEAEEELSTKILDAMLIEGVVVEEIDNIERWMKRQSLMGVPVSDDPEERLLHYKRVEIARSSEDIEAIMDKVMKLTGVNPEDLALARSSFQDKMESESSAG